MDNWNQSAVSEHLKQFFDLTFMRARDRFASEEMFHRMSEASRRGLVISNSAQLQIEERNEAASSTFPAFVEEVKRLVSEGKIPATPAGKAVADAVIDQTLPYVGGDEGRRTANRAKADLRLFFSQAELAIAPSEAALPRPRGGEVALFFNQAAFAAAAPDDAFLRALAAEVPHAAEAFLQAAKDLQEERESYRGTANDLRQALLDVLHTLAPEDKVATDPGYQQDPNTKGPTQRQRAAWILRDRGGRAGEELEMTDRTITLISDLCRRTYERSNDSTHRPRDREEALQVARYVEVVLRDLLRRY